MNKIFKLLSLCSFAILVASCNSNGQTGKQQRPNNSVKLVAPKGKAIAAFAEGCFWCSEHIFESVAGVDSAVSGYAGGTVPNPTYELVNTETTGHAESVLVYYDPKVVSYQDLVNVFFASHDPTTPNRQGPDEGSSYRSILFYQTPAEKEIAMNTIKALTKANWFEKPIVTELKHLDAFYRAEEYHQNYISDGKGRGNPYVSNVSIPRYEKFKRTYKGKLKPGA